MFENAKEGDIRFALSLKGKKSTRHKTLKDAIKAFLETRSRKAFIAEEIFEGGITGAFVQIFSFGTGRSTRSFRFDRKTAKEVLKYGLSPAA